MVEKAVVKDVAVSNDSKIRIKEQETQEYYQYLRADKEDVGSEDHGGPCGQPSTLGCDHQAGDPMNNNRFEECRTTKN